MQGIVPIPGDLSMEALASSITTKEQLSFARLVALMVDPIARRNLATFIDETTQFGPVHICAKSVGCPGTKILSTTAYISGMKTDIDVYRLPLS